MDTLAITNQSEDADNSIMTSSSNPPEIQGDGTVTGKINRGQVVQRGYVLNDTGALKKKLRHESRKEPFNMGVEARDGSNTVIEMKTSFFEHVKKSFINDLMTSNGIESVENGVAAKAPTESSGSAFVEFSLDIGFKVLDKVFITKLTAYTTSCRIMFQPVGTIPQIKALLGNKSVPRYFVDNYFLPWCENAQTNKKYDEKQLLDDIKEEIKRLDLIKLEAKKARKEGRLTSVSSPEVKCVAKVCKYTGLNSNNKSAVGICAKCGGFEHFECSKTKQETREDIQKGELQYFCSLCFLKNPSFIAFEANKSTKKQISPALGIIQVSSKTKALPAPAPPPIIPEIIYKCSQCNFEAETNEMVKKHEEEVHTSIQVCPSPQTDSSGKESHKLIEHAENVYNCDICKASFDNESDQDKHKQVHTLEEITEKYPCNICADNFTDSCELQKHIEQKHKCPLCSLTFNDNAAFLEHIRNEHAPSCDTCEETFATRTELEEHIKIRHSIQDPIECALCGEKFQDQASLDTHIQSQHRQCVWCNEIAIDDGELRVHIEAKHTIMCSFCDTTTNTEIQMEEHMTSVHNISCPVCGSNLKNPQEFAQHFQEQHTFKCTVCENVFSDKNDLEKHVQSQHINACSMCSETFRTMIELSTHTSEKHSSICSICDQAFMEKQELQDHIQNHHSYDCDQCDYKGTTTEIMEQHILEKHIEPDSNKDFKCDECEYSCKDKGELLEHFKENHKQDESTNGEVSDSNEVLKLKEELKKLKNDFQRLESLLQDSLEENNKMKSEHDEKLSEAYDNLRIVKTENEELKEKVDVLFKLGRGYINKYEKKTTTIPTSSEGNADDNETVSIEEITVDDDDNVEKTTNEDLQEWTKNKLRGFKRSTPSTAADRNPSNKAADKNKDKAKNIPSRQNSNFSEPESSSDKGSNPTSDRPRYCHYFSNIGKCIFEERTGGTCKFLHENAPMCQRGVACTRNKCMYKHPNGPRRRESPFLDQRAGMVRNLNPWIMMNPWWSPSQVQGQGPWQTNFSKQ